jgi:hypothetical protein
MTLNQNENDNGNYNSETGCSYVRQSYMQLRRQNVGLLLELVCHISILLRSRGCDIALKVPAPDETVNTRTKRETRAVFVQFPIV